MGHDITFFLSLKRFCYSLIIIAHGLNRVLWLISIGTNFFFFFLRFRVLHGCRFHHTPTDFCRPCIEKCDAPHKKHGSSLCIYQLFSFLPSIMAICSRYYLIFKVFANQNQYELIFIFFSLNDSDFWNRIHIKQVYPYRMLLIIQTVKYFLADFHFLLIALLSLSLLLSAHIIYRPIGLFLFPIRWCLPAGFPFLLQEWHRLSIRFAL